MSPNRRVVVIGVSAGGGEALERVLPELPRDFPLPVVVVRHLHPHSEGFFTEGLASRCRLTVKQADEKERLAAGTIYFAPPNYHLLFDDDGVMELSLDPPVHFSRPSVDVTLESAAEAFGGGVIGVILTGANSDGAAGMARIKAAGGHTVVQDPAEAAHPAMPEAALAAGPDRILPLGAIAGALMEYANDDAREADDEEPSP